MSDELLELLDGGAVREAQALAEGDGVSARIVAGWRRLGGGDAAGAAALLRPLVSALEGPAHAGDAHAQAQQAHAVLVLGIACVVAGEADAGTVLLERALTLHDAVWPRAQCLRFCALALEQRGAWEGAASRYTAAAELYRLIGNDFGLGSALYGAAAAYASGGDAARARRHAEEGVAALRRAGSPSALGPALALLANLLAEGDPDAALAAIAEASERVRGSEGVYLWDVRLRRAEVLLALGRTEEARTEALAIRMDLPTESAIAVSLEHILLKTLTRLGRFAEAEEVLRAGDATPRAPLAPALLTDRAALRLRVAAAGGYAADSGSVGVADAALDLLERGARARHFRHGVATIVAEAADALAARGEHAGPIVDRAARAWQVAGTLGSPPPPGVAGALRAAGARIPLGPLWLEARIGRGGMGDVWRARHRAGSEVAVKILRDASARHLALFDAELQAVARLDHPNVVRVLAVLPVDVLAAEMLGGAAAAGARALVMELVRGGSLDARLSGWGWTEARAFLTGLLAALAHAHARGVLHLDLKPANVLIDDAHGVRAPRLTDFGLAGLARHRPDRGVFGTPGYMAPEQAVPGAKLGPTTDLYAFGCLAWRLFTGTSPFDATTVAEQVSQHRSARLPAFVPTHSVPRAVEEWLRALLANRPEERFACAADAAAALEGLGAPDADGWVGSAAVGGSVPGARHGATSTLSPSFYEEPSRTGGTLGGGVWAPPDAEVRRTVEGAPDADPAGSEAPGGGPDAAGFGRGALDRPAFPSDWRRTIRRDAPPFLPGAGEGLFGWRVGRMVGREAERDRLWDALGRVHADGSGRALWITGAPGLGRSALLGWLAETAVTTGAAWVLGDGAAPPDGRPRLLLLDDPAPPAARAAIEREAESATLVVVASPLPAPPGIEGIELAPLSDDAIHTLLDERLPIDRALAIALAARAEGSPAFAVALLTDLVRRDVLEPGPEGFRARGDVAIALPDDLRSLWTARLDALAAPGTPRRTAWEIAATLGEQVPTAVFDEVCRRAGLSPDPSAFAPLEAEGWYVGVGDRRHFRVPAVPEALRAGAVASGRALTWHALVADALPAEDLARGTHLAAAGRHAEALRLLRRAAAAAVNATRLEECRALLEAWDHSADALGMAPDDPARASPLVVRVHLALHTHEDPYPLLERGLRLACGIEAAQLAYTLGWVLAQDGRHAEAEVAYLRALEDRTGTGADALQNIAKLALAASRYARGIDADALVDELRVVFDGAPSLLVRLDAAAGRGALRLGRLDRAEALLRDAVANAHELGIPDVEAEAHADLAELAVARGGDPVPALEAAVAALAGTGSDKVLRARIRLAAAFLCAGREVDARVAVAPARRSRWRLRPADDAELAVVEAALDGADVSVAAGSLARPSAPIVRLASAYAGKTGFPLPVAQGRR